MSRPGSFPLALCVHAKRTAAAAMFGLACVIPVAPARAADLDTDRTAIQTAYQSMNADYQRHDLTDVMSYFTPDYTEVDRQGKVTDRDQAQRQCQDQLKQVRSMQSRYTVVSCTEVPAGVEIEIRVHTDGSGYKKVLFGHVHGTFSNDLWVRDLWVETSDGWRIKHRLTFQNDTHTSLG